MRNDEGQAMIEFALGLPLLLLAAFYAFALLDAAATQASLETGAQRAATILASTNDDAQAIGAASRGGWIHGQQVAVLVAPNGSTRRCAETLVTVTVSAGGHLGFLLPLPSQWSAQQRTAIESNGTQADRCARP